MLLPIYYLCYNITKLNNTIQEVDRMKTYKFSVKDDIFPQVYEGDIQANSPQEAENQIRDEYAYILDTEMDALIVTIAPLKETK